MIKFEKDINGIHFNVNFMDEINVIKGYSGTGKTFLFNMLRSYCMLQGIPCAYIDYTFVSDGDIDLILEHCVGKELIILDNADLYLNHELFNNIRSIGKTIIMSKKSTYGLNMTKAHVYMIGYDESSLSTRRLF